MFRFLCFAYVFLELFGILNKAKGHNETQNSTPKFSFITRSSFLNNVFRNGYVLVTYSIKVIFKKLLPSNLKLKLKKLLIYNRDGNTLIAVFYQLKNQDYFKLLEHEN